MSLCLNKVVFYKVRGTIIGQKKTGYDAFSVPLSDLDVHSGKTGSAAIVRGIVTGFQKMCISKKMRLDESDSFIGWWFGSYKRII